MKIIRKMIMMFLAVAAVAVTSGITPVENAKAESDENGDPICTVPICATHAKSVVNMPIQRRIDVKEEGDEFSKTYKTGENLEVTKGFKLECSLHNAERGIDYTDETYTLLYDIHHTGNVVNNPTVYEGQIEWTSDNPSVASVTEDGVVEGLKAGTTVIKVQYGEMATSINLTVTENRYEKQLVEMYESRYGEKYGEEGGDYTSMYFDKNGNLIIKYTSKVKLTKRGKKYYKKLMKKDELDIILVYDEYMSGANPMICIRGKNRSMVEGRAKVELKLANHKKAKVVTTIKIKKKNLKFYIPKEKIDLRTAIIIMKNSASNRCTKREYKIYKSLSKKNNK